MEAGTRLQPRARADPSAVQREPGPDGSRDHSNAAIEVSVTHCAKGARARWKPGRRSQPKGAPSRSSKCKGSPGPMEAGTHAIAAPHVSHRSMCKGSPGPMEAGTCAMRAGSPAHPSAKGARARWKPGHHPGDGQGGLGRAGAKGARARWKPGRSCAAGAGTARFGAKGARARWKPGRVVASRRADPSHAVQREPGPDGSRDQKCSYPATFFFNSSNSARKYFLPSRRRNGELGSPVRVIAKITRSGSMF